MSGYRSNAKTAEARAARVVSHDRAMEAAMKFISAYCGWKREDGSERKPTVQEPSEIDDDDIVLIDYIAHQYKLDALWKEDAEGTFFAELMSRAHTALVVAAACVKAELLREGDNEFREGNNDDQELARIAREILHLRSRLLKRRQPR
jgi:hypothetical protein